MSYDIVKRAAEGGQEVPPTINVADLEVDEDNIAEMDRHGLTVERLFQVWEETPKYRRNKSGEAASHQMIGPDAGGGFLDNSYPGN